MKCIIGIVALCCAAMSAMGARTGGPVGVVSGRVLVKPKNGVPAVVVARAVLPFGGTDEGELAALGIRVVNVPPHAWAAALNKLKQTPGIEFAEPDVMYEPDATANDPYFSSAWHLEKIQAPLAWDSSTGNNIVVAILDTGVDASHPDLSARIVPGWNAFNGNSDTADVYGHGTAVAGAASAIANNGVGVAGVAGGSKIMPIRVSDAQGYGYDSAIATGLKWAADRGARVANISYEVSVSSTVKSAAQYFQSKGGVVTVSAGNYSTFETAPDNPYVITVGATDRYDVLATWSNYGNNVDLVAPGVGIMTTLKGSIYGSKSGTSFSAPVTAGAVALVLSANPGLTAADVTKILRDSADDLGNPGFDTTFGAGRLNAKKAVALALNYVVQDPVTEDPPGPVADTISPTISITSPGNGAQLATITSVAVTATDNVGITMVQLLANGKMVAASTTAPFTTKWNTKKAAKGVYQLQTKAFDAAGNVAWSQVISVSK